MVPFHTFSESCILMLKWADSIVGKDRERQTPIVHMSKPLNEVAIIKIFVDYYYILKNSSLFQIDAFHNKVSVIDIINFFSL